MRTRTAWLCGLVVILAGAMALNAKRSMTASLNVAPNPAHAGEALELTSSLTNNTNGIQTVTVLLQMRGPCGMAASKAYKVLLDAHGSDTSKAAFQAPACLGAYEATLSVSDDRDGVLVGTTIKNFEVIGKNSGADAN